LQTIGLHFNKKIQCVFGCGGERDTTKRAEMGEIAAKYADKIILTDDNPRHEDPKKITADIQTGIQKSMPVQVIHAREQAIIQAIAESDMEHIILIAGKGHETFQVYANERIPHSDLEIATRELNHD